MENPNQNQTDDFNPEDFNPDDFNPEDFESQIAATEQIDEFSSSVDYENFIVLGKKELSNFCRLVEPLTKATVDSYGKSVMFNCLDNDTVEIKYVNQPYYIRGVFQNKSGKQVKPFSLQVSTLKRLVTSAFASLIFVEENNEINIALCESLLFLDTQAFKEEFYKKDMMECKNLIDKDLAIYTFRKIGASLALTERASEKVVVVKDGNVNFNTGVFTSRSISPFSDKDASFVLYKQVSDLIAILSELSKTGVNYVIEDDNIAFDCDGVFYVEAKIGGEDKVPQFLSPTADFNLNFNANISVINDSFLRLLTVVKGLDYLSDIVTVSFTKKQMILTISSENQSRKSEYKFDISEGAPEVEGEMKMTVDVLVMFLQIVGTDVKYNFNDNGLGIQTSQGKFLIRKA